MFNVSLPDRWHQQLLKECTKRLGRELTEKEKVFITSRNGLIALEMIDNTVHSLDSAALAEYLNSDP